MVLGLSAKISDLNFHGSHVRAQLKKFTKMWAKDFLLLEVVFLMSIFTHNWQNWFDDVTLYSPWSAGSFETHLFGFCFCVTLWTANKASCFSSIPMDSDYNNAAFVYVYGKGITT